MNKSGRIQLNGDLIRYRSVACGDWDIPVAAVRIIGESTNQCGPFADDYFFCFATGPEMRHEASFYAEGRDDFLRALGEMLGCALACGLCDSTDFASRVLWPPSLAGEQMFQYIEIPPKGFVDKLIGTKQNQQVYAASVARFLE